MIKKVFVLSMMAALLFSFRLTPQNDKTSLKCMLQLTNYIGEGAYIITSLVDENDQYVRTLKVLGIDDEWYPDLSSWWTFHKGGKDVSLDGITSATVGAGERTVFVLNLDSQLIDSGYKLRFETAVEDKKYVLKDLQLDLTTDNLNGKFEGSEYIRYARLIPSN